MERGRNAECSVCSRSRDAACRRVCKVERANGCPNGAQLGGVSVADRPNSCRGDPMWITPDGTSIDDDGREASSERTQAERMGLRALPWVA